MLTIDARKKAIRAILITLIIILLATTFHAVMKLAIILALAAANFLFALLKRLIPKGSAAKYLFGFELVMFSTIVVSMSIGPLFGAISGAFLIIVNYIAERRFSPYFPLTISLYAATGYLAYYFRTYDILMVGIAFTAIYNILVTSAISLIGGNRNTILVFNTINVLFNIFLFVSFSRPLYSLLAGP